MSIFKLWALLLCIIVVVISSLSSSFVNSFNFDTKLPIIKRLNTIKSGQFGFSIGQHYVTRSNEYL